MRFLLSVCLMWVLAHPAAATCRQALVLGLDVSGSVDSHEYRLQLDGLAAALQDDEVQAAFLRFPDTPVRFMVFEWSGMSHQRTITGWQTISDANQLDQIADQLRSTQNSLNSDNSTAIVSAMRFAEAALMRQECWQRTFDISGDGAANIGAHPGYLDENAFSDITINALVIGPQSRANTSKNLANVKSLESYFRSFVIRGPGAFAEVAIDYTDFSTAMKRKLIRELDTPMISRRGHLPRVQ